MMNIFALGLILRFKDNTNNKTSLNSSNKIVSNIKEHWAHGLLGEILKTSKKAYSLISLRFVLITTLIFNVFGFPLVSLIPVLGREKLMLSEFNIGILASSEGLGALIGALLI